jgi:lysophospholipase L1-like esterase
MRLGWHEHEIVVPGLLAIDERGLQRYGATAGQKRNVLILGGSVAFGAYASSIETAYFHVMGRDLERRGTPADLTVAAAGAWKSIQELRALEIYGPALRPDVVVFLNGLNDLTNGARSSTLFGEQVETRDGTWWTPTYHEHDYRERVSDYLANMRRAAELAASLGSDTLVVVQPALVERKRPTGLEDRLLTGSLLAHASAEALTSSYEAMRAGLAAFERAGLLQLLDCSRAFDGERATTFADMWHFSDFGHAILGHRMAERIALMLSRRSAR